MKLKMQALLSNEVSAVRLPFKAVDGKDYQLNLKNLYTCRETEYTVQGSVVCNDATLFQFNPGPLPCGNYELKLIDPDTEEVIYKDEAQING